MEELKRRRLELQVARLEKEARRAQQTERERQKARSRAAVLTPVLIVTASGWLVAWFVALQFHTTPGRVLTQDGNVGPILGATIGHVLGGTSSLGVFALLQVLGYAVLLSWMVRVMNSDPVLAVLVFAVTNFLLGAEFVIIMALAQYSHLGVWVYLLGGAGAIVAAWSIRRMLPLIFKPGERLLVGQAPLWETVKAVANPSAWRFKWSVVTGLLTWRFWWSTVEYLFLAPVHIRLGPLFVIFGSALMALQAFSGINGNWGLVGIRVGAGFIVLFVVWLLVVIFPGQGSKVLAEPDRQPKIFKFAVLTPLWATAGGALALILLEWWSNDNPVVQWTEITLLLLSIFVFVAWFVWLEIAAHLAFKLVLGTVFAWLLVATFPFGPSPGSDPATLLYAVTLGLILLRPL